VYVYIYRHFHGMARQAVFARFAAVRLGCPQPEVTWTFVRILD